MDAVEIEECLSGGSSILLYEETQQILMQQQQEKTSPENSPLHLDPSADDAVIRNDPTFEDSRGSSADEESAERRLDHPIRRDSSGEVVDETDPAVLVFRWRDHLAEVAYISAFASLGTIARIYMGRFFGLDCEYGDVHDFMTPLSSRICVTNSGKTEQTGGALFTDLPANALGSFLMGVLSPLATSHLLPWFRPDHPLQQHDAFHTGLTVGLCGCMTTFASWNTQMVVMLDGTDTVLGPQVAAALFGYLIGIACVVASFLLGRHVFEFLRARHATEDDDGAELTDAETTHGETPPPSVQEKKRRLHVRVCGRIMVLLGVQLGPFLLVAGLLAGFFVGDFVEHILFYRKMWMSALFSPFGALLRWYLSKIHWCKRLAWVPVGTFVANILASLLSLFLEAVDARWVNKDAPGYDWILTTNIALEAAFTSSLSTVSTVVREMFDMGTPGHAHLYAFGTITFAMLFGLAVYSPIIRS